jgi:transcriptional regulator with XRE-family HTH domain
MDEKNQLGTLIRNQLILLDRNQSWLAKNCKISSGQISHIIIGRSKPSIKTLASLSSVLNLDYNALIKASLSNNR